MTHANPPTVSVGLPVYNGERYLPGAIDSILNQTFEDLELIISDNGSTDATLAIARGYAARDPRVRVVHVDENRGAMWNFNEVFRQARGPFFKLACHDDLHEPTFIERCMEVYREAPAAVGLVYPRTLRIDEDDEVLGPYEDDLDLRQPQPALRLRQLIRTVRMVNPLFGVHRTAVFGSTRLFQNFVSSDVVLLAELAMRAEFWEIEDRLFLRRDHSGRSERAHATIKELAAWYDPGRRAAVSGRRLRQFRGMLRAAVDAPLGSGDRVRCLGVVLKDWGWRLKRPMVEELLATVRRSGA